MQRLTERELEVLQHLKQGLTSKEIASILEISKRTVDTHISNVCRKFGARNRLDAVLRALDALSI